MKKPVLLFALLIACVWLFAAFNSNDSIAKPNRVTPNEISIMTYNVKLLPRGATFLHHHPVMRAKLIPAKLISENPDVIVFEEAFDGKAVRTMKKKLKAQYPYCAGFDNRKVVTYKRAGGVLMFSKYPLKELESIRYSECKGVDCAGNKGAMLVEVDHPLKKFQLLGTHMQAGGSKELKYSQYEQAGELLKRHEQKGELQFVAGDFNTHKDDTIMYNTLCRSLCAEDGCIKDEEQVCNNHAMNDMRTKKVKGGGRKPSGKKKSVIDYVFVKENGAKITSQERYAVEYKQRWNKDHEDLSDHYAVVLKVRL